jgi:arylsulfatase A-like enzyme
VRRALLDVRCLQAGPDDGASRRVELAADGVRFAPDGAGPFLHQVPPARASWRLQLEPGSLLSFSLIGLAPPGASSRRFAFDLAVDGRELFSQEVVLGVPRTPARHVVDLLDGAAPASGLRRLDLSVRALDGDPEAARDAEALWVRPMLERRTLVPRQRAGEGPNVLLVVVDTLRADHLASYGYGRVTTPSLDARAERGVVFEQAMSQSSWTVPSVATLLTGQYAYTHGLYDAAHWRLLPTVPTLADAFAAAGVSTVCVVANPLLTEANQSTRGFEDVVTVPHARAAQVNRGFLDWLDAHDDERFFAYVHYQEPHEPYAAPGDGLTAFGRPRPDAPHGPTLSADLSRKVRHALGRAAANGGTPEPGGALLVQELIDLYDGEILSWDEQFDALLQDLDRRGVLQDTLVVVTSDHGEEFGEHGLLGHGRSLHDELLHVPLVMLNTPLPPGRRDDLVGLIDLAPTLVRLAGLPAAATQGFAFVGEDLAGGPVGRASLFAQTSHGQRGFDEPQIGMQALIARDLKAIAFEDDDGLLLYDRRDDPLEQQPLAGPAAAELAESCRRLLEEWERRCRDGGAARGGLVDAGAIEALRAMGYVR